MKGLVDIVNFNADASSLGSAEWLAALKGGKSSPFCMWLRAYVDFRKPVNLGIIGGSVADLVRENPEAIALINEHPELFQIVQRPFAHDIALLRTRAGFELNYRLGEEILRNEFHRVSPCFLPPEFMLTNEQVHFLAGQGIECVFVNPTRFDQNTGFDLPAQPYMLSTLFDRRLPCIPFQGDLTEIYLTAIQQLDAEAWNAGIARHGQTVFTWRDGESSFLLPDGVARERWWLEHEVADRLLLDDERTRCVYRDPTPEEYHSYPVHSFQAWFKEFRMLGFLRHTGRLEESLEELDLTQQLIWLQAVGSDILSSVEKNSNQVELRHLDRSGERYSHVITRSERAFEGEEYLAILENWSSSQEIRDYVAKSEAAHVRKLRARMQYFHRSGTLR